MIYTTDQKDSILYQSQVWMSDMGIKLEALERSMQPCDDLYCENYKVRVLITAIQKTGDLEDYEEELLYTCLVEITGIKDYPAFSPIILSDVPTVLLGQPGPTGARGADGVDGTSANVAMESLNDEIVITSAPDPIDPIKTIWYFDHNLYIEPSIALTLDPSTPVIELGNAPNITLNMVLAKGRDDVISSTITSDSTLDTAYQLILDLAALNAGGPSGRSVIEAAVIATTTYTVDIKDAIPITDIASATVTFVYPFFYGSSIGTSITFYSALTKLIEIQEDKTVPFDADVEYFWFGYPDIYPDLTSIKDQNGFEVISAFVKSAELVTSTGLVNNWVDVGYTFYRTILATNIHGDFTFKF